MKAPAKPRLIEPEACALHGPAHTALTAALERNPTVLMIVWEAPGSVGCVSVPASRAVVDGLYLQLGQMLYPETPECPS